MDALVPKQLYYSLTQYWRRRKYQRLDGKGKKKNVRLGGRKTSRFWKVRAIPRLRIALSSPIKMLGRLRDTYLDAMLGLAGKAGGLRSGGDPSFGGKRVPKARLRKDTTEDFESRLLFEIYMSVVASRQLSAIS